MSAENISRFSPVNRTQFYVKPGISPAAFKTTSVNRLNLPKPEVFAAALGKDKAKSSSKLPLLIGGAVAAGLLALWYVKSKNESDDDTDTAETTTNEDT